MSSKIVEKIENEIILIILSVGFELEYIEEVKENYRNVIRVVIDKNGENIGSDDCEIVSRAIEEKIDSLMKEKEYVLEVSSSGLEKALKSIKLFKKYKGKEASIKLFKKTQLTEKINEKEFTAFIIDVDEENEIITFKIDNENVNVCFKEIASAHTIFDFDEFFKMN